jgi:hypothetical protein
LVEDPVWWWSTSPDRYLDAALRLEAASSPRLRLVDAGRRSGTRGKSSCVEP